MPTLDRPHHTSASDEQLAMKPITEEEIDREVLRITVQQAISLNQVTARAHDRRVPDMLADIDLYASQAAKCHVGGLMGRRNGYRNITNGYSDKLWPILEGRDTSEA